MAGETTITVIGNLTNDPELRFTPSGSAVANFTIASTPRTFDRQSNEWKDGKPCSSAHRYGAKQPKTSPNPSPRACA
ncbi:single-stranded DNA-binding protein [Arthrobacter sp. Hiyo8]|nr:single-stranded DNA-binding protein [Arthrobacter sp. Hiyo8]